MPKYIYTAKTTPQNIIQGEIEAESEQEAANKLHQMGYFPISVENHELSLDKLGVRRLWKIPRKELVLFSSQLATLVSSGVNILNSLRIISEQLPNKYLRAVIDDVSAKIKDGKSLSESLSAHPRIFSDLYTSMIHSGETSGSLDKILKRLAEYMEKEEEFRNSVRTALTYPLFIFIVGTGTVVILLTFVIPRLVTMFSDMGQILPLPTKILISISAFLSNYWWGILAVIIISVFLFRRMSSTPQGKISFDHFKLQLPILGNIVLKTEIARMMRILSLLLSSGIPIVSSLDVAISVMGNQILKEEVRKFKDQIAQGMGFAACLKDSPFFSAFITNIVTVGEETGTMETSLLRIADDYEKEIDTYLKTLTRMLEPVIILVMGVVVGFIVLSMLLPIFQMNLIVR